MKLVLKLTSKKKSFRLAQNLALTMVLEILSCVFNKVKCCVIVIATSSNTELIPLFREFHNFKVSKLY